MRKDDDVRVVTRGKHSSRSGGPCKPRPDQRTSTPTPADAEPMQGLHYEPDWVTLWPLSHKGVVGQQEQPQCMFRLLVPLCAWCPHPNAAQGQGGIAPVRLALSVRLE